MRSEQTQKWLIRFGIVVTLITAGILSYYAGHLRLNRQYLEDSKKSSDEERRSGRAKVVSYSEKLADFRINYWGERDSLGGQLQMSWDEGDKLRAELEKDLNKTEKPSASLLFDYFALADPLEAAAEYAKATMIAKWSIACFAVELVCLLCFIVPITNAAKSWFKCRMRDTFGAPKTVRYYVVSVFELILITAIICQFVLLRFSLEAFLKDFKVEIPWLSLSALRISYFYWEVCSSSTIAVMIVSFLIAGILILEARRIRWGGTVRLTIIYMVVNILLFAVLMYPTIRIIEGIPTQTHH